MDDSRNSYNHVKTWIRGAMHGCSVSKTSTWAYSVSILREQEDTLHNGDPCSFNSSLTSQSPHMKEPSQHQWSCPPNLPLTINSWASCPVGLTHRPESNDVHAKTFSLGLSVMQHDGGNRQPTPSSTQMYWRPSTYRALKPLSISSSFVVQML